MSNTPATLPKPSETAARASDTLTTTSSASAATSAKEITDPPLLEIPKHHSARSQMAQVLAGAMSGVVTRFVTQPLDVLKIRFQLQVEPLSWEYSNSKYKSLLQATKMIHQEEGVRALWKGHNAGQVMSVLYGVMQFWSFEQANLIMKHVAWLRNHENVRIFLGGSLAGCVAVVVTHPFDVLRTRFVAQDPGAGYTNVRNAFPETMRTEGIRGLYRGFNTSIVQVGPLVGVNFMLYTAFKDMCLNIMHPPDGYLPTWTLLMCGGSAGICSKTLLYPMDFVKKRLQIQGFASERRTFGQTQHCSNFFECCKLTAQHEGLMGFYKGVKPTVLKSAITTSLYFGLYDKFKVLME